VTRVWKTHECLGRMVSFQEAPVPLGRSEPSVSPSRPPNLPPFPPACQPSRPPSPLARPPAHPPASPTARPPHLVTQQPVHSELVHPGAAGDGGRVLHDVRPVRGQLALQGRERGGRHDGTERLAAAVVVQWWCSVVCGVVC
jgi:hypothetical protein